MRIVLMDYIEYQKGKDYWQAWEYKEEHLGGTRAERTVDRRGLHERFRKVKVFDEVKEQQSFSLWWSVQNAARHTENKQKQYEA